MQRRSPRYSDRSSRDRQGPRSRRESSRRDSRYDDRRGSRRDGRRDSRYDDRGRDRYDSRRDGRDRYDSRDPRDLRDGRRDPRDLDRRDDRYDSREPRRDGRDRDRYDSRDPRRDGRDRDRYDNRAPRRETRGRGSRNDRDRYNDNRSRREPRHPIEPDTTVMGALEIVNGYGFLRNPEKSYDITPEDPYVPESIIRREGLKNGQMIEASAGAGRNGGPVVCEVTQVNGADPEEARERVDIRELVSIAPNERLHLETTPDVISTRIMELISPIGMGARGLLVAPPRSGKTILLQHIAAGVSHNHPDVYILALLVDERPEELTEMQRTIRGEVVGSSLDQPPAQHRRIAKLVSDIAARRVEAGENVLMIMDSITRMARAFNKDNVNSGRTMSGGLDATALQIPRSIFGSARNVEGGGSLTIIATCLVDTGSRMDEHIYEEFKGTGNMDLVLNRDLANARMWPAIDIALSGTRREELLFDEADYRAVSLIRRGLADMRPMEAMESLTKAIAKYPTNAQFLKALRASRPV